MTPILFLGYFQLIELEDCLEDVLGYQSFEHLSESEQLVALAFELDSGIVLQPFRSALPVFFPCRISRGSVFERRDQELIDIRLNNVVLNSLLVLESAGKSRLINAESWFQLIVQGAGKQR